MTDDPSHIIVEPLTRPRVLTVYPLIQSADATVTLPDWLLFARSAVAARASRRGVLLARRLAQRHPCGAVCWRIERHLRPGTLLVAEHIVVLDLVNPEAVVSMLMAALDNLAATYRCRAIRAILPEARRGIARTLQAAGYLPIEIALRRQI